MLLNFFHTQHLTITPVRILKEHREGITKEEKAK